MVGIRKGYLIIRDLDGDNVVYNLTVGGFKKNIVVVSTKFGH